jgi:hypothetical protein
MSISKRLADLERLIHVDPRCAEIRRVVAVRVRLIADYPGLVDELRDCPVDEQGNLIVQDDLEAKIQAAVDAIESSMAKGGE